MFFTCVVFYDGNLQQVNDVNVPLPPSPHPYFILRTIVDNSSSAHVARRAYSSIWSIRILVGPLVAAMLTKAKRARAGTTRIPNIVVFTSVLFRLVEQYKPSFSHQRS
jgi:hypothetical protein